MAWKDVQPPLPFPSKLVASKPHAQLLRSSLGEGRVPGSPSPGPLLEEPKQAAAGRRLGAEGCWGPKAVFPITGHLAEAPDHPPSGRPAFSLTKLPCSSQAC